jgi:triphosphatase
LHLDDKQTTEEAFSFAVSQALEHWQFHQQIYMQSSTLKALQQVRLSILLLLQSVALYLPVLQCDELLKLHKQLLRLSQAWGWQEQLHSIRRLRSKNGPFSRRIPKSQNLMNYLLGRREGLLNAHKPRDLNMSELSTSAQLAASKVIFLKPWRDQISGTELAVKKHASGWLSQSWQTIQQSLPQQSGMDDKQYLSVDVLLRQALFNGFLLADLFADSRGSFRDPWLDLASGIEELKALKFLRDACDELNFADQDDLNIWIEEKTHSVIKVMEQTREVAMEADVYW